MTASSAGPLLCEACGARIVVIRSTCAHCMLAAGHDLACTCPQCGPQTEDCERVLAVMETVAAGLARPERQNTAQLPLIWRQLAATIARPWRPAVRLALLAGLLALSASVARADTADVVAVIRDRAAAHGVSGDYLVSIARCESGLDPHAVGALGEEGLFQLRPGYGLSIFYAASYSSPWSAWESSDFAAAEIAAGKGAMWSCA